MPSRLKFTVGADTDAVRVLYTDTPDAEPDTLLETVEVEAGPMTFELGENSQPGRRWAVQPVNAAADPDVFGALSNVVEEAAANAAPVVTLGEMPVGTQEGDPLEISFTITDDAAIDVENITAIATPEGGGADVPADTVTETSAVWTSAPPPGTYTIAVTYTDAGGLSGSDSGALTIEAAGSAFYLLDVYPGALGAYSLHRLSDDYDGAALQVRRSSDDEVADIGFTAQGTLDTDALLAFAGAGDAYVTTWYDQSGAAHAAQATPELQPPMVQSGALVTDEYGNPGIDFDGAHYLEAPLAGETGSLSAFFAARSRAASEVYLLNFAPTGGSAAGYLRVKFSQGSIRLRYGAESGNVNWASGYWDEHAMVRSVRTDGNAIYVRLGHSLRAQTDNLLSKPFTRLRLGADTGSGSSMWSGVLSEVVVYPTLTEEDHAAVTTAIGARLYGLGVPVTGALLPTIYPDQQALYAWLQTVTEADVTLPTVTAVAGGAVTVAGVDWSTVAAGRVLLVGDGQTLTASGQGAYDGAATTIPVAESVDESLVGLPCLPRPAYQGAYEDEDELARLWLRLQVDGDGSYSMGEVGWRHPGWYTLASGERGIEATGAVRFPLRHSRDERREFGEIAAFWYDLEHPYLTNEMRGLAPLGRRALVSAAVHLMMADEACLGGGYINRSDMIGGWLTAAANIYGKCKGLLPPETQQAFERGMLRMIERMIALGAQDVNSNMDCKAVTACAHVYTSVADAHLKSRAIACARRILFGYEDGQIETLPYKIDSDAGIFYLEGAVREADGPTIGYFGRALFHLTDAYDKVRTDPAWGFLKDVLARSAAWVEAQWFWDADNLYLGGSAFDSRVTAMPTRQQQNGVWMMLSLADANPDAGRRLLRNWAATPHLPAAAQMESAIQSELADVTSIAVVDTEPAVWAQGEPWTMEEMPHGPEGFYSLYRPLLAASDPSTFPRGDARSGSEDRSDVFPAVGEGDGALNHEAQFWRRLRTDSEGKRWGFFASATWHSGTYQALDSGMVQALYMEDVGVAVTSQKFYDVDERANADRYPIMHTWGRDDKAEPTTFSVARENGGKSMADPDRRTIVYDAEADYLEVTTPFGAGSGTTRGQQVGDEVEGAYDHTIRFTSLEDGLRVDVTVAGDGTDLVTELWHTIPLRYESGMTVETWTGAGWALLGLGGTAQTRYVRTTRPGRPAWFIDFGEERRLRLAQQTTGLTPSFDGADMAALHVDLHPSGDGTPQPLGGALSYSLLTPAADPGLEGTVMSVVVLRPTPGAVVPVGEVAGVYFQVLGGAAPYTAALEVTTNGTDYTPLPGMTLREVAEGFYELVGDPTAGGVWPEDVSAFRLAVTDAEEETVTALPVSVTPGAVTLVVEDTFTDAPGTLASAHTPDVGAWTYVHPSAVIDSTGTLLEAGGAASVRLLYDAQSYNVVAEARCRFSTGASVNPGPTVRSRVQTTTTNIVGYRSGTTLVVNQNGTNDRTLGGLPAIALGEYYTVRLVGLADHVLAVLYDSAGTYVATTGLWTIDSGHVGSDRRTAGVYLGAAPVGECDYVRVWTYA